MQYPNYAKSERVADGAMHAVGVTGSITGAVLLIVWATGMVGPGQIAAISVYAGTLIATFVASACYHLTPWERVRPLLRRIDHATIYLKIAGTYTPLVVMIGSWFAYTVLGIVWALAAIGVAFKLFVWRAPGRVNSTLYLIMGWLSLALIWSLWSIVPTGAMVLIFSGGVLYSVGVLFCMAENMKFSNAIWHGFVVAASTCFFWAISISLGHLA